MVLAEGVVQPKQMLVDLLNGLTGVKEVVAAIGRPGLVRQRVKVDDVQAYRIQTRARDDVAGEELPAEASAGGRLCSEGIVDLVLRTHPEKARKVAAALLGSGHGAGELAGIPETVVVEHVEPEGAIAAPIHPGNQQRPAGGKSVAVILMDVLPGAALVVEEVGRVERAMTKYVVQLAVQHVGAAVGADIDDGSHGAPHAGIVRGGLHVELAHGGARDDGIGSVHHRAGDCAARMLAENGRCAQQQAGFCQKGFLHSGTP